MKTNRIVDGLAVAAATTATATAAVLHSSGPELVQPECVTSNSHSVPDPETSVFYDAQAAGDAADEETFRTAQFTAAAVPAGLAGGKNTPASPSLLPEPESERLETMTNDDESLRSPPQQHRRIGTVIPPALPTLEQNETEREEGEEEEEEEAAEEEEEVEHGDDANAIVAAEAAQAPPVAPADARDTNGDNQRTWR